MNFLKIFIKGKPLLDRSGAHIFKYGIGLFYLNAIILMITGAAMIIDPPTKLADLLIALFLIGALLFMCIQTRGYHLRLENHVVTRISPWPWHKRNVFLLKEILKIDIRYRAFDVSLFMDDGRELRVPIMLNGAFQFLQLAISHSNTAVSDRVRTFIDYYSKL